MRHLNSFKIFESGEYSDEFDEDYKLILDIFREYIIEYNLDQLPENWQEVSIDTDGIYYDIFRADCVMIYITYYTRQYGGDEFINKFSLLMNDVYKEFIPRLESIGYNIIERDKDNFEIQIEIYYPQWKIIYEI